jgi:hypothetical protein
MFAACEPTGVDTSASDKNLITFGGRKNAYMSELPETNAMMWGYYVNGDETTWVFGREEDDAMLGVDSYVYQKEITENEETTTEWVIDIKSETKYWNIGTYKFFSVSPKLDAPATATNAGLTITDFDISSQTDIIAAATTDISVTKLEHNEPVTLNYKHLLTKIKFQAHAKAGSCIITEFKIQVPQTATYTHTSAWVTKSNSTWLNFNTLTTLSTTNALIDIDVEGNIDGWLVYPGIVVDKGINYSIYYKMSDNATPIHCEGTLPPLDNGGEAGKSYLYTLELMTSEIKFGPVTVKPWENDTDNSTSLDFNENQ